MPIEVFDDAVGGVAELADVQQVGVRIVLGAAGDRGTADDDRTVVRVRTRDDVVDLRLLDVHARHEYRVGPAKVVGGRRLRVLVDEAHVPALRQVGGHHQQALGGHERADAPAEQWVRVVERAKRARVARIDAQNPADVSGHVGGAHDDGDQHSVSGDDVPSGGRPWENFFASARMRRSGG